MEFDIELIRRSKKKKANNWGNRTTKSRKYQNAREKILLVIGKRIPSNKWRWKKNSPRERENYSKLNSRVGVHKRDKHLSCLLVRFSGLFLKWTWELQPMNQGIRKITKILKANHPRDNIGRLYEPRKKEEEDTPSLRVKIKENDKRDKYLDVIRKVIEHEGDEDINCNWRT